MNMRTLHLDSTQYVCIHIRIFMYACINIHYIYVYTCIKHTLYLCIHMHKHTCIKSVGMHAFMDAMHAWMGHSCASPSSINHMLESYTILSHVWNPSLSLCAYIFLVQSFNIITWFYKQNKTKTKTT